MPICPQREICPVHNKFVEKSYKIKNHLKIHKRRLRTQPNTKLVLLRQFVDTYYILQVCTCCECEAGCLPCFDYALLNQTKQILEHMITLEIDVSNQVELEQELKKIKSYIVRRMAISPPLADDDM